MTTSTRDSMCTTFYQQKGDRIDPDRVAAMSNISIGSEAILKLVKRPPGSNFPIVDMVTEIT